MALAGRKIRFYRLGAGRGLALSLCFGASFILAQSGAWAQSIPQATVPAPVPVSTPAAPTGQPPAAKKTPVAKKSANGQPASSSNTSSTNTPPPKNSTAKAKPTTPATTTVLGGGGAPSIGGLNLSLPKPDTKKPATVADQPGPFAASAPYASQSQINEVTGRVKQGDIPRSPISLGGPGSSNQNVGPVWAR